ncbi:MAG: PH domain-containing protein [Bacteroides sp.]|nr:PH domain-containing protein [Bacteroides sp.]
MNRTFHARIAYGQWLFLLLVSALAVYGLWERQMVLAIVFVLLLVFCIERLIHTTYTVTADGKLLLYYGRFARGKEILLTDITSVRRASSMRIGRFAVIHYVLVSYGAQDKCVALLPVNEDAFVRCLEAGRQMPFD